MKKIIKSIILAMIVQFSFSYTPVLNYVVPSYVRNLFMEFIAILEQSMHSFGIENFIVCIALAYIIYHKSEKSRFNVNSIIAVLFTLICLISKSIISTGSISGLYHNTYNIIFAVISFIGYYVILKIIVDFVYEKVFINKEIKLKEEAKDIYNFIFEKHPCLMPAIIILIFYLPYIIITFPGTVSYDGYFQIRQFFTDFAYNHHPFLSTMFFYCLYSVGDIFLSPENSIFGIIIFQIMLQLVAYSLIFKVFKEEKVSNIYRILSLVFICLFVVTKIGTVTVQKDTLFQTGLILFTISIYYYLKSDNSFKKMLPVLFSAAFLYLFKNNSIHIIIITMIVLLLKDKCYKRIIFNVFIITLFLGFNTYYHNVFIPKNHIIDDFKTESLYGEIQCVARYLKYYPNDLTLKEKQVLDKVFINNITYNPENADYSKSSFNEDCDNKCISDFKKVWISLGLRHPIIYIDTFFNNYYGYLYPTKEPFYNNNYNLDGLGTYISFSYYEKYSKLYYPSESLMLQSIGNTKMRMPFISIFYNCAICSWILILLIGYLIKNRLFKMILYLTPVILSWICLFLSPVNAFMRYVYPLYIPILFTLGLLAYKTEKK